jgi:hypothetical protein
MRGERAGGLDAEAGGDAGHQHALARKAYAFEHIVGGRFEAEGSGHGESPAGSEQLGTLAPHRRPVAKE